MTLSVMRKLANWPSGSLCSAGIVLRDILGHVGREPAVALPHDQVRGVGGVDHVDRVDAARIFLADALEHALGAGALDPHRDAGIFRLERLADLLGERQVDRGVPDDLAFLLARPRSARASPLRRPGACATHARREVRRRRARPSLSGCRAGSVSTSLPPSFLSFRGPRSDEPGIHNSACASVPSVSRSPSCSIGFAGTRLRRAPE